MARRVRWIDTDASGVVHFSNYVRMMEEAEYAFLRSRGLGVVLRDERGTIGFPRLSSKIDIRRPLKFDEEVVVKLKLVKMDGKSLSYSFEIQDHQDQPAVVGSFKAACCRFPDRDLPFAILLPEFVVEKLIQEGNHVGF